MAEALGLVAAPADQSRSTVQKQEVKEEPPDRHRGSSPFLFPSAQGATTNLLDVCPRWCEVKLTDLRSPSWGLVEGAHGPCKEELLICGGCGESFAAWASLGEHQCLQWAEKGPSVCSLCGKAFHYRRNLLAHKKLRGKRRYTCGRCGIQFCLRGDLLRHRASHTAEGVFPCATCSRVFPSRRHLLTHQLEHAPKGPQRCPNSGEAVGGKLQGHGAAQEGERPFTCATCGNSFCWKESLHHHQRLYHQAGGFSCAFCGRTFLRHGNLLAHQRVHTGEMPFSCPQCQRCFATKANLTVHRRLHCGDPDPLAHLPSRWDFCSGEKLLEHHQASHIPEEKMRVKEEP
ncbi:hypothetical protein JRQ81_018535 [Phrynocephalus forsythii]|uniref:C2H2-type domain-containing protein n=1 Tax=Phrynocephalus forsythii TaxID=171643 RepID=A0A9Q1AZG0_9SAUR|nr:hypothetical protein JRQ81_018535 [Phrynocephalus forsythii]